MDQALMLGEMDVSCTWSRILARQRRWGFQFILEHQQDSVNSNVQRVGAELDAVKGIFREGIFTQVATEEMIGLVGDPTIQRRGETAQDVHKLPNLLDPKVAGHPLHAAAAEFSMTTKTVLSV
jgi:hypothetical protein